MAWVPVPITGSSFTVTGDIFTKAGLVRDAPEPHNQAMGKPDVSSQFS